MYYRNKNGDKIDGKIIKENFTIENTVVDTVIKIVLSIVLVVSFIIAFTSEGAKRYIFIFLMFLSFASLLMYIYLFSNIKVDKVDKVN